MGTADEGNADPQFGIEVMPTAGGSVFDALAAADVGATVVLTSLLEPSRLSRLVLQHARDGMQLSPVAVIDDLLTATTRGLSDPLRRRIAYRTLMTLAGLVHGERADPEVAAMAAGRLASVAEAMRRARGPAPEAAWRRSIGALLLDRERLVAELRERARPPEVPPGMPIGSLGAGGWSDG